MSSTICGCGVIENWFVIDTQVMRLQVYQREADYWIMRNFTHKDNTIELTHQGIQFTVAEVYEKTTFDDAFAEE